MMVMDGKQDFNIKKKYCPSAKQNVVFKISNLEPKNEICMDSTRCQNQNCEWKRQTQEEML